MNLSQLHCTDISANTLPAISIGQGDCQWPLQIPTNNISPACIVAVGIPNLYSDYPITSITGHVPYPRVHTLRWSESHRSGTVKQSS